MVIASELVSRHARRISGSLALVVLCATLLVTAAVGIGAPIAGPQAPAPEPVLLAPLRWL